MRKLPVLGLFLAAACFGQTDRFVMDGHVHMINRQFYLGGDISDSYQDGQVDLPRIRKGGLSAIFFSLFSQETYYTNRYETAENCGKRMRLSPRADKTADKNPMQNCFRQSASS
jgi:hypothetical protein